jgi:hypothetical protein
MRRLGWAAAALALALGTAGPAPADVIGIDTDSGNLYRVSTSNAALTLIGNTAVTFWGDIQFAPNGTLYGFTVGVGPLLYRINPTTAASTPVGSTGLALVFEGGLAFSPGGTAYGANSGGPDNDQLFTINLTTGAATLLGTLSGSHDLNGLAYRSDGKLVGLDRVINSLLLIDPATLAVSTLAPLGPTVGAVGGMTSADGSTGYFSTSGPVGSIPGTNSLYSFNLFTGSFALVGSFAPTIGDTGISGLAQTPIPEPASLSLTSLAAGLAALAGNRRRSASTAA